MPLDLTFEFVVNAAGGLIMAGFGLFVMRSVSGGPSNRGFSLFALGFGLAVAFRAFAEASAPSDPGFTASWFLATIFWWCAGAGLILFGLFFPVRLPRRKYGLLILPGVIFSIMLVGAVLLAVDVLSARPSWAVFEGAGGLYGPSSALALGAWTAVLALLPLRHRTAGPVLRRQIRWVAGVLFLFPSFSAGAFLLEGGIGAWAALALIAVGSGLWLWETARPDASAAARNLAILPFLMAFLGLLVAIASGGYDTGMFGSFGLVRVVSVALLALGILRTQLFDIDLKVKWTLQRGTLAAIFVTTVFVVSEMAQEFFGTRTGSAYIGTLAAGVLVFAIAPLQRLADRIADVAMPRVQNTEDYLESRKRLVYRGAVESALLDGMMSATERRLLLRLQRDLGLTGDEANQIEGEVLQAALPGRAVPAAE